LVHYTGKCVVKNGTYKKLKPLCEALLERGLTAKIEN
jgi:ATP-dependent Clp protease adaptor protein ClpS